MNKEKQFENMAKELCVNYGNCNHCSLSNPEGEVSCSVYDEAELLYNAGYRKSTDVALEAVDNFQSRLKNIFCTMCCDNDYNTVCLLEINSAIESLFDVFIAELKKKYTESE